MMYPRTTENGKLVDDTQMVGAGEHLRGKRILNISGAITSEIDIPTILFAFDSISNDSMKLVISSPGGDLDSAFLIYDTIKLLESPVITLGRFCASAAVLLLAAGKERYLMPHAKVMLHLHSNYFAKDTSIPVQDMEIIQRESKKYKDKMIDILIECGVKRNRKELLRDIDRDFWLDPHEAIEYGLADKIIDKKTMGEWLK